MANKPTTLPRWADGGNATPTNCTAPTAGTQDTGYVPNDLLPAQTFNWLINLIYQWLLWLSGVDAPLHNTGDPGEPALLNGNGTLRFSKQAVTSRVLVEGTVTLSTDLITGGPVAIVNLGAGYGIGYDADMGITIGTTGANARYPVGISLSNPGGFSLVPIAGVSYPAATNIQVAFLLTYTAIN